MVIQEGCKFCGTHNFHMEIQCRLIPPPKYFFYGQRFIMRKINVDKKDIAIRLSSEVLYYPTYSPFKFGLQIGDNPFTVLS